MLFGVTRCEAYMDGVAPRRRGALPGSILSHNLNTILTRHHDGYMMAAERTLEDIARRTVPYICWQRSCPLPCCLRLSLS